MLKSELKAMGKMRSGQQDFKKAMCRECDGLKVLRKNHNKKTV